MAADGKLVAYRESTHTFLSVTWPYYKCNPTCLFCIHNNITSMHALSR